MPHKPAACAERGTLPLMIRIRRRLGPLPSTASPAPTRHARRRPAQTITRAILAVLAAAALSAVACGSGNGGVQFARASATPTPSSTATTSAGVPDRPQRVLAGGNAVAAYLSDPTARRIDCLPELVSHWQLPSVEGVRCLNADLDGDRQADFAFVVGETPEGAANPGGDVWFFRQDGTPWRLTTSARVLSNQPLERARIAASVDLTGDGLPDPVIVAQTCTSNGCQTRVVIVSGHLGTLANLTPSELADGIPAVERVETRDTNGDRLLDLVITTNPGAAGTQSGASTGSNTGSPPRRTEWTATWSGVRFFARRTDEPAQYRIHAILDADQLAVDRQYREAAQAYLGATAPTLRDWSTGGGPAELVPFAYFRASMMFRLTGDAAEAARSLHLASTMSSASLIGRAAGAFEAALTGGATTAEACGAAEGVLRPAAAQWAQVWAFGSAIPPRSIDTFCR